MSGSVLVQDLETEFFKNLNHFFWGYFDLCLCLFKYYKHPLTQAPAPIFLVTNRLPLCPDVVC